MNISRAHKVGRDTLRHRVKSTLQALILAVLCLLSPGFAQERHNSLAVDEKITDAGPYYFISHGDSSNAFAQAAPLAEAMGLELAYDNHSKTISFSRNGLTARIKATSDVPVGLVKQSGVLEANGIGIASPMAIIVDGVAYVPIVPIAKAFGCDYAWHSQYRLITVDLPRASWPQPEDPSPTPASPGSPAAGSPGGARLLPAFRLGVHQDFSRVALDLGATSDFRIAVDGNTMLISFEADRAREQYEERDSGAVRRVYYASSGGKPALIVQTEHAMTAAGNGFRVGRTDSNTLFVDFGPNLRGGAVAQLVDEAVTAPSVLARASEVAEPLALAPATAPARPTVVIDAGHGGVFPGTSHGGIVEKTIVLRVALLLKDLLEERGVDVILTRDSDEHLSANHRRDLAERASFATPDRNLFISIHANAASSKNARGIETFVFGEPLEQSLIERAIRENGGGDESLGEALTNESIEVASREAGQILSETQLNYSRRLAHSVQQRLVAATGAVDRGVKQNVFFVIRNARAPAILVELGFVSNPEEGRKLASESYQATLARALADGVLEFLSTGGTLASN